ncbi:DUF2336 domain-containing protein [Sphingomonas sp. ASV193]|uniref:DUF2336 domain-containing protein n=1 Tax=Sphingomonas sp. ASV193 TaxID=3144405 RepID=UPI0032E87C5D
MSPVEWPIAALAADHSGPATRSRGRDRLSAVRTDFFLDDDVRLTEQERALMGGMLAGLLDQLVDELMVGLPDALAERIEVARPGLLRRLWERRVLDRPELVALLLRRSDEQRLSSAGAGGPVAAMVGDADEAIAESAMALTVARGRRKDRFGRLLLEYDDLPGEEAQLLVQMIAAALRLGLGNDGADQDPALADAALDLIARHDEDNRLDARVAALARLLHERGRATDELAARLAEAGEVALLSAMLSVRAGVGPVTGWLMLVEQGAHCTMLLARLAGIDRPTAARIVVALGEPLGMRDPAAAIGEYDRLSDEDVEQERRWMQLPRKYRDALKALDADENRGNGERGA